MFLTALSVDSLLPAEFEGTVIAVGCRTLSVRTRNDELVTLAAPALCDGPNRIRIDLPEGRGLDSVPFNRSGELQPGVHICRKGPRIYTGLGIEIDLSGARAWCGRADLANDGCPSPGVADSPGSRSLLQIDSQARRSDRPRCKERGPRKRGGIVLAYVDSISGCSDAAARDGRFAAAGGYSQQGPRARSEACPGPSEAALGPSEAALGPSEAALGPSEAALGQDRWPGTRREACRRAAALADAAADATRTPAGDRCRASVGGGLGRFLDLARSLVGLGPGLTPTGDDILVGYLAAGLTRPESVAASVARSLCRELPSWSGRTGFISAAYLRFAAQDRFDQAILTAACRCSPPHGGDDAGLCLGRGVLPDALSPLLHYGHTSGEDIALGILLGLAWPLENMPWEVAEC